MEWCEGPLYTAMNIYGEMRLKIGGNQEGGGVGHGLYTSPPPTVTASQARPIAQSTTVYALIAIWVTRNCGCCTKHCLSLRAQGGQQRGKEVRMCWGCSGVMEDGGLGQDMIGCIVWREEAYTPAHKPARWQLLEGGGLHTSSYTS